ncbi:MAG TPA: hypothetical protein VF970_02665 [Gemmatimonadales bacterium]
MRLNGLAAAAAVVLGTGVVALPRAVAAQSYEVWLIDQSDTRGKTFGGTLYVFDGADLAGPTAAAAQPRERIDLSAETAALCLSATGANPVRPHMVLFGPQHRHAVLAFVASGHVVVYEAAARRPLACFRTTQSSTGRQAHAAVPAPDGSFILVANQNGKRLERIDADLSANRFVHNETATLDLTTCRTPAGQPCEAPELRPDNAPICPVVDPSSRYAFVTLRGGGLLVVDPKQTPMVIVGEYDKATVNGNGCGGIAAAGGMYLNSGGRPGRLEHLSLYGFDVYRFPLAGFGTTNPVNMPAPAVVFSHPGEHDSHGMASTAGGRFVWVIDRHANVAEVISSEAGRRVNTVDLAGSLSADPAPDLVDASPDGGHLFVSLRGPTPLSGDPHVATGTTPGLGVIQVGANGQGGSLTAILRISNMDSLGVEKADPHAVRVRRR